MSEAHNPIALMVARSVEIEAAEKKRAAEREAAEIAAGVAEANNEVERLDSDLSSLWWQLAFTKARTSEGVLANLRAASGPLRDGALDPEEYRKNCGSEEVAWMAAADLAILGEGEET